MDRIRQWFADHDDGEFPIPVREHPFSVIPPLPNSHSLLYTTKPHALLLPLSRSSAGFPCGVIARYGLPDENDVEWLRNCANGRQLLYLGDADPCDLLVFAWLRPRIDISFRGLSDALLEKCGVTVTDSLTMAQSDAETGAVPLVTQLIPDFAELLGPHCAAILGAHRKIELEVLSRSATVEPLAMMEAWDT